MIRALVLIAAALWAFWTYWLPTIDVPYVPDWMIPGASCATEPREPGGIQQAMSDAGGALRYAVTEPPPTPDEMRDRMVGWVTEAGRLAGTFSRSYNGRPYVPPPARQVDTPTPAPASGATLAAQAGASAGWSGADLVMAVAVAGAESGFDPSATNDGNRDGTSDFGLWQTNSRHAAKWAGRDILDPYVNAQVAHQIWVDANRTWQPWTVAGSGRYRAWLDEAEAAVASLGAGVIPAGYDPAAGCEPGVIPAGMPPGQCPADEARLTAATVRACRIVVQAFGDMSVGGWGTRPNPTEHDDGRALDFMTYTDQAKGEAIADYLVAHASELRTYYVMFDRRIWNSERADEGWRPVEDRGGPTANHEDHVHLSLLAESGTV